MKTSKFIKLAASLLLPLVVGSIAGIFTTNAIPEWYASLNRPWFNPPNWVFGPGSIFHIYYGLLSPLC